jgi:hypothetical protein
VRSDAADPVRPRRATEDRDLVEDSCQQAQHRRWQRVPVKDADRNKRGREDEELARN